MNKTVNDHFLSLCAIPHKSHHEEEISLFLYNWAIERGLQAWQDEVGNVIIDKPASKGCHNAPRTILQAHMDMVVVWVDGKDFDPLRDHVEVISDGKTMHADGTSLGGDDGAGVALAMAVLEDKELPTGPVRAIFTVDEEDGMSGADNIDPAWLDASYMLNLDWEEAGSLCCSSAGGEEYAMCWEPHWEPVSGRAYAIRVDGLNGGHSGAMIHLGRANAIRVISGLVDSAVKAGIPARIASFEGGVAHNAIPNLAAAVVVVPEEDASRFEALAREAADKLRKDHGETDPQGRITVVPAESPAIALTAERSAQFAGFLTYTHHGVNTMSQAFPSLVETSANLAMVSCTADKLSCEIFQRGSNDAVTADMRNRYAADARTYGASMEILSSYPGWPVRENSHLMELTTREYKALTGKDMVVEPVHAGLECGNFSTKQPKLDIVSIGPNIYDIHSTSETLDLDSVDELYQLVTRILKAISEE